MKQIRKVLLKTKAYRSAKNYSKRFHTIETLIAVVLFFSTTLSFISCSSSNKSNAPSIAVYIPGIMEDSPIYANLAKGVLEAAGEYNAKIENQEQKVQVYVMEAGTNQAEWGTKLKALTATGKYDLIISSNPSLPELAEPLTHEFPQQKYIFLDGALDGNENIATVSYNQKEQAYLSGYIAGLYSKTHKVALIAAQEYPIMNNVLYPYFARGAQDAKEGTTCDFRIVGNWYDASKGAEITTALYENGVDVVLPICGGASAGVISAATEKSMHITWFDENAFSKAPGTIISSCMAKQDAAAKEMTLAYLKGETAWGTTKTVGFMEGYIEFIQDDPLYISTVDESIREEMKNLIESIRNGSFQVPSL